MEDSLKNMLTEVQKQLISLREKQGFESALQFGNAASVNENRNELYLIDFHLSSLIRMLYTLKVQFSELVTDEIIEKYMKEWEREVEKKDSSTREPL